MSSINLSHQVNTSNITYDGPMANSYGGKFAKVSYNGKWPLIQTPKISVPFGLSVYEDKDKNGNVTNKTYSFDVSFNGYDEDPMTGEIKNPKIKSFYDLVTKLDNHLVDHVTTNSFTWIDDPDASKPVCKALLRAAMKWSRDKETKKINTQYAPRMKMSLPLWEGEMKFKAFVGETELTEVKNIEELESYMSGKCEVTVICRCDRITFNGGKYGFKWTVQQLKIYPGQSNPLNQAAIINESDDEEVDIEIKKEEVVNQDKKPTMVIEDSSSDEDEDEEEDEEEEEEEEEEDEPEPEPEPPKKKRSRKPTTK